MIGGIVTEIKLLPDKIWINTVEANESSNTRCAIYVERNAKSEQIKPADTVWWQGGFAMWTPYDSPRKFEGKDCDIRIPRIGCSGVSRP